MDGILILLLLPFYSTTLYLLVTNVPAGSSSVGVAEFVELLEFVAFVGLLEFVQFVGFVAFLVSSCGVSVIT